ncbi:transcription factor HES-5-like [Osmerus eperlanus]|uniref:transcription factor HES-5-like n=1 Tax=Osmerus eperlanus TaxID=29151 RepID=UPI002E12DDEC
MAPTVFGQMNYSKENLTSTHKLRKPMVEKLRRDRINTSIEQLKSLLSPEFLRQQPDSKQEKADILEMAVYFLKHWRQQQYPPAETDPLAAASQGYSHCVKEALSFLSQSETQTQSHRRLLSHFQSVQSSSAPSQALSHLSPPGSPVHRATTKRVNPTNSTLWRPW